MTSTHPNPNAWIQASASRMTVENIGELIATLQKELRESLLPTYREAVVRIDADHQFHTVRGQNGRKKLRLSVLDLTKHMACRTARKHTQQEMQVVVPALALARKLEQELKRPPESDAGMSYWRQDLAKHFLSFALRTPKKALSPQQPLAEVSAFSFSAMTEAGALKAQAVISSFPGIFGSQERGAQASPCEAQAGPNAVDKYQLFRKLVATTFLTQAEQDLLEHVFGFR